MGRVLLARYWSVCVRGSVRPSSEMNRSTRPSMRVRAARRGKRDGESKAAGGVLPRRLRPDSQGQLGINGKAGNPHGAGALPRTRPIRETRIESRMLTCAKRRLGAMVESPATTGHERTGSVLGLRLERRGLAFAPGNLFSEDSQSFTSVYGRWKR